jgi:hypothetical protein
MNVELAFRVVKKGAQQFVGKRRFDSNIANAAAVYRQLFLPASFKLNNPSSPEKIDVVHIVLVLKRLILTLEPHCEELRSISFIDYLSW